MKIIVINGLPKAGKSLFVGNCLGTLGNFGKEISTIDFVKEVAILCGWNKEKNLKNRKFLSDLKDLLTEWNDVPMKKVKEKIRDFWNIFRTYDVDDNKAVIFIHCREPKEIQRFVDELGARTLLILRDSTLNNEQSNHADSEVFNFTYDYTITNNGTFEELEEKADNFLHMIRNENWESKYPEEEF